MMSRLSTSSSVNNYETDKVLSNDAKHLKSFVMYLISTCHSWKKLQVLEIPIFLSVYLIA